MGNTTLLIAGEVSGERGQAEGGRNGVSRQTSASPGRCRSQRCCQAAATWGPLGPTAALGPLLGDAAPSQPI